MKLKELDNLSVIRFLFLDSFYVLCIKFIGLFLFYLDIIDMMLFEDVLLLSRLYFLYWFCIYDITFFICNSLRKATASSFLLMILWDSTNMLNILSMLEGIYTQNLLYILVVDLIQMVFYS